MHELDWGESLAISGVTIHCVPVLHFSARGILDRNKTLWCGYVIEYPESFVYFAGDTSFGSHFAQIRAGAVLLRTTPAGSTRADLSSFPSKCSAESSAASLSPDSRPPFSPAHSSSTDISYRSRNREPSPLGCGHCFVTTGWSTANGLSPGQSMCCAISAHIPIGSPSRTTGWGSLRGQRNLSLARLRSRQQEAAHDHCPSMSSCAVSCFTCCRVGFMRIRNFGFLANRRRSTLFPIAPVIRSSSRRHIIRAAHSFAVAMSALRRNHASSRTPLRRATAPPIPASSQPVRRMNPQLQRRISLVHWRARCFCVSRSSECGMVARSSLSHATPHDHSLCHSLLKPKRSDRNGKLANDQNRLIQIQIP